MSKALMWIIGIIAYIFLGWIAKDIIFSMIEITPETTLGDIQTYEYIIYSAISVIILIGIVLLRDDDYNASVGPPILLVIASCVIICNLPIVMGTLILYNLVNVIAIIWGAYCTSND